MGEEAAHPLGGVLLHLPSHAGVGVECKACAVVAQDTGHRFGVHSLLDRQRGEGVKCTPSQGQGEFSVFDENRGKKLSVGFRRWDAEREI